MTDLTFGLELTLIGMGAVFALLILLMVLVKIIAEIWGPKQRRSVDEKGERRIEYG